MQGDEVGHLIRQHIAAYMQADQRPVYGHVVSYNPAKHSVVVLVPSMADPYTGQFVLSPEMPFGTGAAGALGGIQYHPITGSTQENPTAGEQVQIGFFGAQGGVAAASAAFFNEVRPPLSNSLPSSDPLQPGEMLIGQHAGNYIRVRADGGVDIPANALRVGNLSDTLQALMNEAAMAVYNAHTHPDNGQPPTQQMTKGTDTTTILKAN